MPTSLYYFISPLLHILPLVTVLIFTAFFLIYKKNTAQVSVLDYLAFLHCIYSAYFQSRPFYSNLCKLRTNNINLAINLYLMWLFLEDGIKQTSTSPSQVNSVKIL